MKILRATTTNGTLILEVVEEEADAAEEVAEVEEVVGVGQEGDLVEAQAMEEEDQAHMDQDLQHQ